MEVFEQRSVEYLYSQNPRYFGHYHEPVWSSTDKRGNIWCGWYELAKNYYAEHGDLLIPRDYSVGTRKLGRWIERQRAAYNGRLSCGISSDHIIALDLIGMVWKLETRMPWDEWYTLAENYFSENQNLFIPKDCIYHGKALGAWIGEQRRRYKENRLTEKQVSDLERIGMLWRLRRQRTSCGNCCGRLAFSKNM